MPSFVGEDLLYTLQVPSSTPGATKSTLTFGLEFRTCAPAAALPNELNGYKNHPDSELAAGACKRCNSNDKTINLHTKKLDAGPTWMHMRTLLCGCTCRCIRYVVTGCASCNLRRITSDPGPAHQPLYIARHHKRTNTTHTHTVNTSNLVIPPVYGSEHQPSHRSATWHSHPSQLVNVPVSHASAATLLQC